jgi:hypothetical protein
MGMKRSWQIWCNLENNRTKYELRESRMTPRPPMALAVGWVVRLLIEKWNTGGNTSCRMF